MPAITTTLVVSYCGESDAWHAHVCSCSLLDDMGPISHGGLHKDFGPFDTHSDVLQWVYREASALIRDMPGQLDVDAERFLSKGTTVARSNERATDVVGGPPSGATGSLPDAQSGERSE